MSDLLKTFSRPPRSHARRDNTKRQLIEQAREPLRAIIRKHGLRLADLAALLAQCGLPVHRSTLKRYLGPVGRPHVPGPGKTLRTSERSSRQKSRLREEAHHSGADIIGHQTLPLSARAPVQASRPQPDTPLVLTSQFVPKAEIPYEELVRQADERQ